MNLVPVILSGGVGTRLWPESRRERPKQLSRLAGPASLLQLTAQRAAAIPGATPPILVCGRSHHAPIVAQLAAIGHQPQAAILEPTGRNTAPAAAAAALSLAADQLMLVLPADHIVTDVGGFVDAVKVGAPAAESGHLVVFGIPPTGPETGFGYVEQSEGLPAHPGVYFVERFVEKPDIATAERFLAAGTYSWNSGMFLFRAGAYLDELKRFAPKMVEATRQALERGTELDGALLLDEAAFSGCPANSIDYAVMEHTGRAALVPLDAGWSDVGSWSALWEVGDKDRDGNVVSGSAYLAGTTSSYVRAGARTVAVVGMDRVVVVEVGDAVLVAHMDKVQDVREIVARLEAEGSPLVERHPE